MSDTATDTSMDSTTATDSTVSDSQPTQADLDKLNAAITKERELRKAAEKAARDGQSATARLAEIEEATASETEKAVIAARKEGETTALGRVNTRLVRAEARAVAAEIGFTDPADAVALIDLAEVEVDEEGEVDSEAVKKLLEDLADRKKYLLKAKADTSASDAGIGATGSAAIDGSPGSLIRAGLSKTSTK